MTILFVDIVESTRWASLLGDQRWLDLRERHEAIAREAIRKFHGTHVQPTGDGFVVTFVNCMAALSAAQYVVERTRNLGIEVRAALHCGECEIRGRRAAGIAFHVCARIMALATAGEILVSHAVREIAPASGMTFVACGRHALRGLPGEWQLYRARNGEHPEAPACSAPANCHDDRDETSYATCSTPVRHDNGNDASGGSCLYAAGGNGDERA